MLLCFQVCKHVNIWKVSPVLLNLHSISFPKQQCSETNQYRKLFSTWEKHLINKIISNMNKKNIWVLDCVGCQLSLNATELYSPLNQSVQTQTSKDLIKLLEAWRKLRYSWLLLGFHLCWPSCTTVWYASPCLQLKDLQDKYSECEDMLREAREDIKNLRNKSLPNSTVQRYTSLATVLPMDSLAAEIEGTFRKGLDTPAPSEYKWACYFVCACFHMCTTLLEFLSTIQFLAR